jgi:hypothetical protein
MINTMKIVIIALNVILLAFTFIQMYFMHIQRSIETYPYVVKKNTSNSKSEIMKLLYLPQSNFPQKGIRVLQAKDSLF